MNATLTPPSRPLRRVGPELGPQKPAIQAAPAIRTDETFIRLLVRYRMMAESSERWALKRRLQDHPGWNPSLVHQQVFERAWPAGSADIAREALALDLFRRERDSVRMDPAYIPDLTPSQIGDLREYLAVHMRYWGYADDLSGMVDRARAAATAMN